MRLLYKAILFDLDNTLLNTEKYYEEALIEVYKFLQKHLKIVSKEEFVNAYHKARDFTHHNLASTASSHSRILYLQYTFEILGIEFDSSLIYEANEIYWKYVVERANPYDYVEKLLDILQTVGIRTCLVTDNKTEIQMFKLKESGLDKYINYIVSAEEVGRDKPGASQFLFAINKMNILAKDALVVGNNPETDIKGANNAGIDSCLFDPAFRFEHDSINSTYKIHSYKELMSILGLHRYVSINNEKRLLIVDGAGTVFNNVDIIKEALYPILSKIDPNISINVINYNYDLFSKGFLSEEDFMNRLGISWDRWQRSFKQQFLDSILLDEKTLRLALQFIRDPDDVAVIVSNIPYQWGNYLFEKYNLFKYFVKAYWAGQFGLKKPDVRLIYKVWNEVPEVKAKNIFIIDDHLEALRSALGFDFNTVWIKRNDQPITFVPTLVMEV